MNRQISLFSHTSKNISASSPTDSVLEKSTAEDTEPLKWMDLLKDEFEADYYKKLRSYVKNERAKGKVIYPPDADVFASLSLTPFSKVKAVILGQDPYHGPNQAHGLSFSVRKGVPPPPSLINIFKELESDLGFPPPRHGSLKKWARQGVLLLNSVLTVEAGKPGSHKDIGWQCFTDRIVEILNEKREGLVFLLWGSYARKKGEMIDPLKHYILEASHPSPFSANRGFFGCRHFSKVNLILSRQGKEPIDWRL